MPYMTSRDKEVAREIHRIFRSAWWQDIPTLIVWVCTRPPALLIYNVFIPFQVAYALQAIITRNFAAVTPHAWTILGLALAYCILWGIGGIAIVKNAKKGMIYMQRLVFANYLEKDYAFFNNNYVGALGVQASRLREALDDYDQIIYNGVSKQLILVTASVTIIAMHSILLAVVTLVCMVLVLSFTMGVTRWRIKYRRLLSEASSETAGVLGDALGHGTTVKSFAAEEYEKQRLNHSLYKLANYQYIAWMTSIPADVGRMLLAAVATFLLIILTSRLYASNSISIAIVVLVQLYVVRLVMSTQDIADLIKAYETTMSVAHQAVKTMMIEPTVQDPAKPRRLSKAAPTTVQFNNVSYRYPDASEKVFAIKNFSLNIQKGEKVGFVGYSGSGKTTLTKLLFRFMDVTGGYISIDGIDTRELAQRDLRNLLSYVPQEPLLFHRSVSENIAYGKPTASNKAIVAAGKTAYVSNFINELPQGYDTIVGEKGIKLSGGQRQRVAIARALLKDAPILILDEATSSLDSRSEQYIQKAVWKLMRDRTALVIAHRLSTIQKLDRIVVMHKGKIVQIGTHQQLLKDKNGIYAQLWAHQSGGYIGVKPEV